MNRYQKFKYLSQCVLSVVSKMKQYDLTLDEALYGNIIPQKPFQDNKSRSFFKAITNKDLASLIKLLGKSKRLVLEFNEVWQNGYHIATKRGLDFVLYLLLQFNGNFDSRDMTGRTPLMWAIEIQNVECIRLLLAAGANPFVTTNLNISLYQIENKMETNIILDRAKKMKVIKKFAGKYYKQTRLHPIFPNYEEFGMRRYLAQIAIQIRMVNALGEASNMKTI